MVGVKVVRAITAQAMYGVTGRRLYSLPLPHEIILNRPEGRYSADYLDRDGPRMRFCWARDEEIVGAREEVHLFCEFWADGGDDGHVEYYLGGFVEISLGVPNPDVGGFATLREFMSHTAMEICEEIEKQMRGEQG